MCFHMGCCGWNTQGDIKCCNRLLMGLVRSWPAFGIGCCESRTASWNHVVTVRLTVVFTVCVIVVTADIGPVTGRKCSQCNYVLHKLFTPC